MNGKPIYEKTVALIRQRWADTPDSLSNVIANQSDIPSNVEQIIKVTAFDTSVDFSSFSGKGYIANGQIYVGKSDREGVYLSHYCIQYTKTSDVV